MNKAILHATTGAQVQQFLERPSHALVLVGPTGSGTLALAQYIAETLLAIEPGSFSTYPYALTSRPDDDKKSIGVEMVRELEYFMSLKVPRSTTYNRVVIIDQAELLTIEAQNALLKILEEPPKGTLIILCCSHLQALQPTIRSRVQAITLRRPSQAVLNQHFSAQGFSAAAIEQAYVMSGGLPELMQALLSDSQHPLMAATQQARSLLQQSTYDRLCQVDSLAKKRELAMDTLYILQQMAHVSLQKFDTGASTRWQNILAASYSAQAALAGNGQTKLVLTNFMLSM